MKAALVSSSGGHLLQLRQLEPWWREHERFWVTFPTPDAKSILSAEEAHWAHHPTTRSIKNLLLNLVLAFRLLIDRRPDVIVTTGAGVALPFFVVGRLLGIKTVYVEVYDRIELRTLTGRLCRPLADLFLVQWDEQRRLYSGAEVIGRLL